jgi:hypothetical protein
MKRIITAIIILVSSCNEQPAQKQTYQLERFVYDSVGNLYHDIQIYDHIPTQYDSIKFYK